MSKMPVSFKVLLPLVSPYRAYTIVLVVYPFAYPKLSDGLEDI